MFKTIDRKDLNNKTYILKFCRNKTAEKLNKNWKKIEQNQKTVINVGAKLYATSQYNLSF